MVNAVYWEFESLNFSEVTELFGKLHIGKSMAFFVTNGSDNTFRLAAYGIFPGNAEDWGFEDASCGMFKRDITYLTLKEKYETMKANGELLN